MDNEVKPPALRDVSSSLDQLGELPDYGDLGLGEVRSTDLVIPRLKLMQGLSPLVQAEDSDVRSGQIVNVTTGENYGSEVSFIAANYWESRTHWESKEMNSPIECSSVDARVGMVKDQIHAGGVCEKCTFNQWTPNTAKPGKNLPPECKHFKNIMMILITPGASVASAPWALYSGKGTALGPVNRWLTAVKGLRQQSGANYPIYVSVWKMKADKIVKNGNTWYNPKFERIGFVTKDMIPALQARYIEFEEIRQRAMELIARESNQDEEETVDTSRLGDANDLGNMGDDDSIRY